MHFETVSAVTEIEIIAAGNSIREAARLRKIYGPGRWRKLKGVAVVSLADDVLRRAEVHWYEANGIGRKEFKIKRFLD